MAKVTVFSDGTKCYTGAGCRKHNAQFVAENHPLPETSKGDMKISKTLSFLLRHQPGKAELTIDDAGWVEISELVTKINAHKLLPAPLEVSDVARIVANDSKRRYSVKGSKIRAAQGHSFTVNLGLTPKTPPATLYHGTSSSVIDLVRAEGLKAMSREHVHLSDSEQTAQAVGNRHSGDTIILKVNAANAHKAGVKFYQADNGVWLVDALPSSYLE